MKVEVVHISDKVLYNGPASHVLLPGVMGEFEVGEDHGPIIALLSQGRMMIRPNTKIENKFVIIKQGLVRFDGEVLYAVVE